jgi:catechol 2,3-dioxygenase-like lactoylglutathione lyase family enzyme
VHPPARVLYTNAVQWTVEHIGLAAADPVALARWYGKILGAEEVFHCENPGKAPTFFLRFAGGLFVEIYPATQHRPGTELNSVAGWRHLALRVPSVEIARDQLTARGAVFTEAIKPAGGGAAFCFSRTPRGICSIWWSVR